MAIVATTITSAMTAADITLAVASATGITAPNYTTGVGITYLFCEQELMQVTAVNGLFISVLRGYNGTVAAAHGTSAPIIAGLPADFASFAPAIKANVDSEPAAFQGWSSPVAGAATNVATGPFFHLTGTVAMVTLTAPAGVVEGGKIVIVFDGSAAGLTWTAAGNIAVAGTATTAGSAVMFVFDSGSAKWHPLRLA